MATTAKKSDPELWDKVKQRVTAGDKGGKPGQWSARKAQMAVQEYKAEGGTYEGRKDPHNHLVEWTREDWGTKSGNPSLKTGERYLPKEARDQLSEEDYARTTKKKRADLRRGQQHSSQPADIRKETAGLRLEHLPVAELRKRAALHRVPGRSRMNKAALVQALGH